MRAFLVVVLAGGIGGEAVETSYFWSTEGIGDGPTEGYAQDTLAEWQRMLWNQDPTTEGVATTYQGGLEVTAPGGLVLRVASGGGVVYGYGYRSTGNVDHTLVRPVIGNTGWRVVLRTDWATRTVRSALLQSADGVATIPALTQIAGVTWEISLAHGVVSVAGVVTIQGDDRTPLGSGGRFTVQTEDIADNAVTPAKLPNRTRTIFIPATGGYEGAALETLFVPHTAGNGWSAEDADIPPVNARGFHGNGMIPADFVAGATLSPICHTTTAGNYWCQGWARYGAIGEAFDTHGDTLAAAAFPMKANELTRLAPITLTKAATGDYFCVHFWRDESNAADTGSELWFLGWELSYTADS